MIKFAWPWMFLFIAVPYLIWRYFPRAQATHQAALLVPKLSDFQITKTRTQRLSFPWRALGFLLFIWVLLVVAGARPYWIHDLNPALLKGRNLLLAVDVSGSMRDKDFNLAGRNITRLQAAKGVVGEFVKRRRGDRLGVIVFGGSAYLYVPLTFDRVTLKKMLDDVFIGITDTSTAIGDAIGLAVKTLEKQAKGDRVLILMTDGKQSPSPNLVSPLLTAEIAKKANIKIYTIGIGPSPSERTGFGQPGHGHGLDEGTLKKIAGITGGQYFRAYDVAHLNQIYRHLDRLEPAIHNSDKFRPKAELYHWVLALVIVLVLLRLGIQEYTRRRA